MIIPEHRLEAIDGLVVAMGMSVDEQRELVRAYREQEPLRAEVNRLRNALAQSIESVRRLQAERVPAK